MVIIYYYGAQVASNLPGLARVFTKDIVPAKHKYSRERIKQPGNWKMQPPRGCFVFTSF